MASIADILAGLSDELSSVTGLRATDYVPESVSPPAAFVNLTEITEESFGLGSLSVACDAVVLTARGAVPRIGQRSLYDLYRQIVDAIATNEHLGLTDGTQARVVRYRSLSIEEVAAMSCYGGAFEILVTTPG